jgi:membrane-bound lytic murein transglycosylase B
MKKIYGLISLWLILVAALAMSTGVTEAQSDSSKSIVLTVHPYLVIKRDFPEINIVPGESESQIRQKEQVASSSRNVTARERVETPATENTDLASLRALYQEAAARYGIDWKLIEAVHQVETGKSGSGCVRNPSGATGPMQFLPSTFRAYSDGGDICNLRDAVFAGANLLANGGADRGDIDSALFNYNHSMSYVNLVKSIMNSI